MALDTFYKVGLIVVIILLVGILWTMTGFVTKPIPETTTTIRIITTTIKEITTIPPTTISLPELKVDMFIPLTMQDVLVNTSPNNFIINVETARQKGYFGWPGPQLTVVNKGDASLRGLRTSFYCNDIETGALTFDSKDSTYKGMDVSVGFGVTTPRYGITPLNTYKHYDLTMSDYIDMSAHSSVPYYLGFRVTNAESSVNLKCTVNFISDYQENVGVLSESKTFFYEIVKPTTQTTLKVFSISSGFCENNWITLEIKNEGNTRIEKDDIKIYVNDVYKGTFARTIEPGESEVRTGIPGSSGTNNVNLIGPDNEASGPVTC